MEVITAPAEIACMKALASLYLSGEMVYQLGNDHSAVGLTPENYEIILGLMELCGAIHEVQHAARQRYWSFRISPMAVQLSRQIAEKEAEPAKRKNVVEDIKYTLQCHPVAGWLFVAFTAITLFATAITQIGGALKVVGLIK